MAVVRRTAVWIRRYQSLMRRSLASGCSITAWVDTEAVCNCHTPSKVPSSDRANSKPKPRQRRFPMAI